MCKCNCICPFHQGLSSSQEHACAWWRHLDSPMTMRTAARLPAFLVAEDLLRTEERLLACVQELIFCKNSQEKKKKPIFLQNIPPCLHPVVDQDVEDREESEGDDAGEEKPEITRSDQIRGVWNVIVRSYNGASAIWSVYCRELRLIGVRIQINPTDISKPDKLIQTHQNQTRRVYRVPTKLLLYFKLLALKTLILFIFFFNHPIANMGKVKKSFIYFLLTWKWLLLEKTPYMTCSSVCNM